MLRRARLANALCMYLSISIRCALILSSAASHIVRALAMTKGYHKNGSPETINRQCGARLAPGETTRGET